MLELVLILICHHLQIYRYMYIQHPNVTIGVDAALFLKVRCLRQIVLAGLGDHVARRIATDGMNTEDKKRLRYAYQVRSETLFIVSDTMS